MVQIDRRLTFISLRCERSGKYTTPLRKLTRDDTSLRKCECLFKLCEYLLKNNKWRFNLICGTNNQDMCHKLVGHPTACCLMLEEKKIVSDIDIEHGATQKYTCNF